MAIMEEIRAAEDEPSSVEMTVLAALNAVTVTPGQLSAACQVLGQLANERRWYALARRSALGSGFDEPEIAIEAIDARLLAVRKWEDIHDPDRVMSQLHLMEAGALAPLVETEHGIGFRDTVFCELVDFIAGLPW